MDNLSICGFIPILVATGMSVYVFIAPRVTETGRSIVSDHSTAFVPIEAWCYNSPSLLIGGRAIDVGLLAEALLYYDKVIVNVGNQLQFRELLVWFISQGKYGDFLSLIRDGELVIYDYSFISSAVLKEGEYSIWNMQDELSLQSDTFEQRYLRNPEVQACLEKSRDREKLYKALRGKVIEAKADQFSGAIENARIDLDNPERNALILQSFVDEVFAYRKLGTPPKVAVEITQKAAGKHDIKWNINFDWLSETAGKPLNFSESTPLTANAHSNRILLTGATLGCDLYLGNPIGSLVGNKLYESSLNSAKSHSVIENLKEKVEFPDIRGLVNCDQLGLADILAIRKKSGKFREWLQIESERDRDAIIAYHNEVTKATGLKVAGAKVLNVFGMIAGGATGAMAGGITGSALGAGTAEAASIGGAVGALANDSVKGFIDKISSKLDAEWKPIVFGKWVKTEIETILSKRK